MGEVWCRAEVVQRPPPPAPARVHATLRPGAPDVLRTAALSAGWLAAGARQALGALDRRNLARLQRDLQARRPAAGRAAGASSGSGARWRGR